jgi:predicted DNA-binding transcriptional regulator AlpA
MYPKSREELLKLLKDEFLTLKEVLYIIKLSRTTVWKLVKAGKLPRCPNTGRTLLFTAQAVYDCFTPKKYKK